MNHMKKPITKFAAIVATPVFPKTMHQFRPVPEVANTHPKPPKRDNIFSKSRDTRQMKTSHNAQTFSHGR